MAFEYMYLPVKELDSLKREIKKYLNAKIS